MSESEIPDQLPNFNLDTMSGIFPGTRTRWYYLLHLSTTAPEFDRTDSDSITKDEARRVGRFWAKAFWFEEPSAVIVMDDADQILAQVDISDTTDVFVEVELAIEQKALQLISCGTCQHWTHSAPAENTVALDNQTSIGTCEKSGDESANTESQLSATPFLHTRRLAQELIPQSAFALSCPYWEKRSKRQTTAEKESTSPQQNFGYAPTTDVDLSLSEANDATWIQRISQRLGFRQESGKTARARRKSKVSSEFSLAQLDRSGVGAGTEPCLGCHGRIANLGALIVETDEGDKQTFSVWRCRNCAATYLNSWIDRWERLDNLETEETLYRIAPPEAVLLLERIHGIEGADHPQEREKRVGERLWFEAFLNNRTALSHQVRHGR